MTTTPVGTWVSRIADDVLLTCWPPAPLLRYTSSRTSLGSMSMSTASSISGVTSTSANEVCRRAAESNGLMRTSRCTPRSDLSSPKARGPVIRSVADLMPASSPGDSSMNSTVYFFSSAQRRYMRISISAQSCESVPPAPAWMPTMAGLSLYGSL